MSQAGRSSGEELPAAAGGTHRSNRAQDSEQFLIVRDIGLVYVREHRSNVRTIEQILFKYSRDGHCNLNGLYRLYKSFFHSIWVIWEARKPLDPFRFSAGPKRTKHQRVAEPVFHFPEISHEAHDSILFFVPREFLLIS